MKRNILLLAGMAAASLMVSCQKEEGPQNVQNTQELITRTVTIEEGEWLDDATKTVYEPGTGVKFTGNEVMCIYYDDSKNQTKTASMKQIDPKTVVQVKKGTEVVGYQFSHDPIQGAESYDYYFVLSGVKSGMNSKGASAVAKVGAFQQPGQNSFDPNFDVLVGQPLRNVPVSDMQEVLKPKFRRMTTPVKMTINDTQNVLGEDIILANLTFSQPREGKGNLSLSGYNYITMNDDFNNFGQSIDSQSWSNSVIAHYPAGHSKADPVWYSVYPAQINSGTISLSVSTATRTYYRSVDLTQDGFKLASGIMNEFSFDISGEGMTSRESLYQDFSNIKKQQASPGTKEFTASDGNNYSWTFTGTSHFHGKQSICKDNYVKVLPTAVAASNAGAEIVYPMFAGKTIEKVRIFLSSEDNKTMSEANPIYKGDNVKYHKGIIELTAENTHGQDSWNTKYVSKTDNLKIVGIAFEFAPAQ